MGCMTMAPSWRYDTTSSTPVRGHSYTTSARVTVKVSMPNPVIQILMECSGWFGFQTTTSRLRTNK
jgi:hypothetical protein